MTLSQPDRLDRIEALVEANAKFSADQKIAQENARKALFATAKSELQTKLDNAVKAGVIQPAVREKMLGQFSETDESINNAINFSVFAKVLPFFYFRSVFKATG